MTIKCKDHDRVNVTTKPNPTSLLWVQTHYLNATPEQQHQQQHDETNERTTPNPRLTERVTRLTERVLKPIERIDAKNDNKDNNDDEVKLPEGFGMGGCQHALPTGCLFLYVNVTKQVTHLTWLATDDSLVWYDTETAKVSNATKAIPHIPQS